MIVDAGLETGTVLWVRTHYDVLGVSPSATRDEVRSAHRRMVTLVHPDRAQSLGEGAQREATRLMAEVNTAWHVLSDESRRASYDESLQVPEPTAPASSDRSSTPGPSSRPSPAAPVSVAPDPEMVLEVLVALLTASANQTPAPEGLDTQSALTDLFEAVVTSVPSAMEGALEAGALPGECLYATAAEALASGCHTLLGAYKGGALTQRLVFQLTASLGAWQSATLTVRPGVLGVLSDHPVLEPLNKNSGRASRSSPAASGASAPPGRARDRLPQTRAAWVSLVLILLVLGGVLYWGVSQLGPLLDLLP